MIVDLLPSSDHDMIIDALSGTFQRAFPVSRLQDEHAAHDGKAWSALVECGLFALALPESRGGAGYGVPEQVIAARELGKHLITPAALTTMIAAQVGDDAMAERFTSGTARAAPGLVILAAVDTYQAHDASDASYVLLWDHKGGVLVEKPDGATQSVDLLDGRVTGERILIEAPAWRDPMLGHLATLLYAAYLVGVAEVCVDRTIEYVKQREQFGRPIGTFQAIKHQCADMVTRARAARAQCYHAALALAHDEAGATGDVIAARILANDAASANARANVQLHGAMGFTFEAAEHHFLKRAHLMAASNFDRSAASKVLLGA